MSKAPYLWNTCILNSAMFHRNDADDNSTRWWIIRYISKFHFHQQFGYSTTSSHASYTVENNTISLNNRDTCTQFFNFSQLKLSSTVIVVVVLLKVVRKMATINPEIDLWNKSSADPEWCIKSNKACLLVEIV